MVRLLRSTLAAVLLATAASTLTTAQPATPPTPESVLGFVPCADYTLGTSEQIAEYFRALDRSSDRIQLVEMGQSAEGRTELLAIISSAENLRRIDRLKAISERLAMARDLTDQEARALADEGRAVVWIDFGLHSTEVAHAQTAPILAYRAVTDESAEMQAIRDNVVLLLVPDMNPDGTTLVANWYMQHVGTPYEHSSPPELYQKYVGHDNNRDWFMFNMPESRNAARQLYEEWFPQIVYNQHQAAPFPARIFVPPFEDPMNPSIPPLVMRGINLVGDAMTRRFDQEGKSGVISRISFDTWWNGGMRTAPYFHNMVGILTETAHASATPAVYDPVTFPRTFADGTPTLEPTTYYPNPYRGGEWQFRDSCEYMLTGSMAVLDIGAKRRGEWLYDIYQMGRDAIAAGATETYIVSGDQHDPGTAVKLVNTLRRGGVEIERALEPFTAGGTSYPAGSFLIRGAQPFRPYVTDLLNPQVYPDRRLYPGGPPERPYDLTGWTLPLQMGVEVTKVDERVEAPSEPVTWAEVPEGAVVGDTSFGYAIDPRANDAFLAANRAFAAGDEVFRVPAELTLTGETWPAGAFVVGAGPTTRERLEATATELGLRVVGVNQRPDALVPLDQPRVGLYHAWGGNMDEGWTRWLLEQFEFPFQVVHDDEIRAGNLGSAFDVLILPDATFAQMVHGLSPGTMPPEYTGGMTIEGAAHVRSFVLDGGTLVALDTAASLPLTLFDLPVRDVTEGRSEEDFFIPGTVLALQVNPDHPLGFGMATEAAAFFVRSPAFEVGRPASRFDQNRGTRLVEDPRATTVANYPADDLLLSGWALGEDVLANRAAAVEVEAGEGRIVLLGFRAQHRGQPHGTFKLLFNAIYRGSAGDAADPPTARRTPER